VAATEPDPAPSAPPPTDLASLRGEYDQGSLEASDLGADPLVAFQRWFDEVVAQAPSTPPVPEPNVMVLATVDADGRPAARAVLLKGIDERGLRFFTNLGSAKASHLAANPACALVFVWPAMARQVRVTGHARPVPTEEAAAYFASRPRNSQLGAWASQQSEVIDGREELDRRLAEIKARYLDTEVPLPPFWGGYVVEPDSIEFWQGRRSRLHDRLRYSRTAPGREWTVERLSP